MAAKVTSVFRPLLLAGKSAVVTGGGTGIGKAITQELLYLGCSVMIASRNVKRLTESYEAMKAEIPKDSPARLEMLECNIRKEEQVVNLVQESIKRLGGIDFLVNNAGGQFPSPAANISTKGFNAVIDTNLTGTFVCCREVYNQWMNEHGGVIVNIIADMWKGFPMMSHTGAARSAVDNLTKSLALEWAADGVRVNAVAPGSSIYSDTANANYTGGAAANIFQAQIPNLPTKRLGTVEEVRAEGENGAVDITFSFQGSIYNETAAANYVGTPFEKVFGKVTHALPTKRQGTVPEVSASVVFLLSPAATFISGETLRVDGAHSLYAPSAVFTIPEHDKQPAYTWEDDLKTQEQQPSSPNKKSKL